MKNTASTITLVIWLGLVQVAFASDVAKAQAAATHQLKDGGTLYIFTDGKMAKEDKYGKAVYLKKGETLETIDAKKIVANGNEVARLNNFLTEGHSD